MVASSLRGCRYNCLRPECVATAATPLSSDAFTMFGRHNAGEHNAEVRHATNSLLTATLPGFAEDLESARY